MDFEFSAEQQALRRAVRRFLDTEAPLAWVRERIGDERGTTDAVWKGLADLGATGLLVPAEHGGAGGSMVDMGVVLEELGRAVHPGPLLSSAVAAVLALRASGSGSGPDAAHLLPGLADGSVIGTLARHGAVTVTGDDRLTGAKDFVPDAVAADLLLVTAATSDGPGLFAVARDAAGLDVAPRPTVDVTRRFGTVTLAATPARRIGSGDPPPALAAVTDALLVAQVVDGVGAAQTALDLAVAYAKERTQFDRPIGSFQAVQHLCTDMLQWVELSRTAAYYALWALDAADPAERHRAATMAQAYASDALPRVGATAIQVFGGVGFTWDHDIGLFAKRLLTLQLLDGSASYHLEELARLVI